MSPVKALTHYANKYYDPAKAHEYYIKNRQPKGDKGPQVDDAGFDEWAYGKKKETKSGTSTKKTGLSDAQKAELARQKADLASRKQTDLPAEQTRQTERLNAFREKAKQAREQITTKLATLSEKLSTQADADRKTIIENAQKEISKLQPIPENISEELRSRLMADRKEKINSITLSAKSDLEGVTSKYSGQMKTEAEKSANQREQTRMDLQGQIETARATYTQTRDSVKAKYDKEYQSLVSSFGK